MPFLRQAPGQDDMPVEHAPRRVGDRVLLVVAFGQHSVEGGDRATALLGVTGALHQFWQLGKH
ncbi:hypothetical protein D3C73_1459270 [compost metagenome]